MEILSAILIIVFIASVIAWLFNWSQACSFLKEPKALSFFFWPTVFNSDMFKPEGEKYRKKSLIYLFLQILPIVRCTPFNGHEFLS